MAGRAALTDERWAMLEPLLPMSKRSGRPPMWTKRQLIDGIRWRLRVGAPWRDVPVVYGLFRRWHRTGGWTGIVARLQAIADAVGRLGLVGCVGLVGCAAVGRRPTD
nr:transposase [Actinophytocola oryzae]